MILKRTIGIVMLLFFPIMLLIDRMFGFVVTGVEITFMQSVSSIWNAWKDTYWESK